MGLTTILGNTCDNRIYLFKSLQSECGGPKGSSFLCPFEAPSLGRVGKLSASRPVRKIVIGFAGQLAIKKHNRRRVHERGNQV